MLEYKKSFLNEIKVIFPYFMEFSKNRLILSKEYSKNCIVSKPNKRPIIKITHGKSIFFSNNR